LTLIAPRAEVSATGSAESLAAKLWALGSVAIFLPTMENPPTLVYGSHALMDLLTSGTGESYDHHRNQTPKLCPQMESLAQSLRNPSTTPGRGSG